MSNADLRLRLCLLTAALSAALSAAPATAAPAVYDLDPAHSFVHFEVLHFGTSTIRGRFGPVTGEVELDREARRGKVGLAIATAGVDTGLGIFNARLREGDLLAVQEHPQAFFVAERFRFDERGAIAEVRGEFTFRGQSEPLSLNARLFACRISTEADAPAGREICGGEFEAEVQRSRFGATFGLPLVGDRVRLRVQVEGVRRAAPPR
jgi:polyisoprenoid-binding protein YceI